MTLAMEVAKKVPICMKKVIYQKAQQQRLVAASQLMASTTLLYSAVATNKCMNLLLQQQQSDTQRNEFPINSGLEMVNPGSRQIYLTFPADSTFREEDVSNYSRYKHSHVFFVNVNGKVQEAAASAATNGEMRQANKLQGRRLIGLQLLDVKRHNHHRVKEFEARWIGWAGVNVPDEAGQRALTKALAETIVSPLPRSFQSQFAAYVKASVMFAAVKSTRHCHLDKSFCMLFLLLTWLDWIGVTFLACNNDVWLSCDGIVILNKFQHEQGY
ncbi:hypothetical protein HYC85_002402 [Camellia sinensis]|uniref:Uncharacterized protein n=1 Tax=Camellia sinensis TaxID=4442 RepID=A0A7J7I850_CAMSI|nr:hypothetical protein HYC85_002402 [Camellia sinensis]